MSSISTFDCLFLIAQLQERYCDASESEIQFFSYLACLLYVYDGKPASRWGYDFILTGTSTPYSIKIQESMTVMKKLGWLKEHNGFFSLHKEGVNNLNVFKKLSQNSERLPFLRASSESVLALPLNIVKMAIANEPALKSASMMGMSRSLLEEETPASLLLYDQFKALHDTLKRRGRDLVVPAVVWLNFLTKQASSTKQ